MSKPKRKTAVKKAEHPDALFGRIVSILEEARGNVVRAVNTNMVLAYWMIGREIVQELQGGGKRAEYGKKVVEDLSARLTERYGKGFSGRNLKLFRQFYLTYSERLKIVRPLGAQFSKPVIPSPLGRELGDTRILSPLGRELTLPARSHPMGSESLQGFSPQLTWSHYRALMRVESIEARDFYERESVAGAWDKRTLERQIQSFYYERMLKSRKPEKMLAEGRHLPISGGMPIDALKNPYVLEFLGLPDAAEFHE